MPLAPRYVTADYYPDTATQTEAEWLAQLGADGWQPWRGYGVDVVVNGVRRRRWTLVDTLDIDSSGPWPEPGVPGTALAPDTHPHTASSSMGTPA